MEGERWYEEADVGKVREGLRAVVGRTREEALRKMEAEVRRLEAEIEGYAKEKEELSRRWATALSLLSELKDALEVAGMADRVALDYDIREYGRKGCNYAVVLTCEDGTKVALSEHLVDRIVRSWRGV